MEECKYIESVAGRTRLNKSCKERERDENMSYFSFLIFIVE